MLNKCSAVRSWLYSLLVVFLASVLFRFDCKWVRPGIDGMIPTSADSRGIKNFQIKPGESCRFALARLSSPLAFLPGILVTSECLDQQPDLALCTFSRVPHAATLGCSVLLLPRSAALVGSTGCTSKPGTAHCPQCCLARMERDGTGQLLPSWHRSVPLSYSSS